jgi:hypothetical protein
MFSARQSERIDDTFNGDFRLPQTVQFSIDEAKIEHGIVRHELRTIEKFHELIDDISKGRLFKQLFVGDAVHRERFDMNLSPLRVDEFMEGSAGGKAVDHFHAADFDDAILQPFKASGFRIENDLTHGNLLNDLMLYSTAKPKLRMD